MWWFATCDVMWPCCPVLLHYYKVLCQYHSVLQSTTPVLQSARPVLQSTTPENTKHHHKHTNQKLKNTTTNTPPEETFTFRSPTRNKHNHCSPQRHTILLLHFLLSSWPQSAKTYDLKKHVLSYLLHLTNTIIAVRKDIQYSLSIFSCLRGRNPQRHTTFWNIYFQISYTYQTQPWQSANADNIAFRSSLVFVAAVRKNIRPEETFTVISPTLNKHNHCSPQDIQYSFSIFPSLRGRSPQRHTTSRNIYFQISYT